MKKIGLLGGSFDPPHKGHLYISLEAKKILKLDEIWWLVTPKNPLKLLNPASYEQRMLGCKNLTKNHPIKIKEIEKKINSKYSYQTINYLKNHYSKINFFWLMGADNLINFHKWQKWQSIFKLIPIVIFKRHGYNTKALNSKTSKYFFSQRVKTNLLSIGNLVCLPAWTWVNNREINISSTEIRKQRKLLRSDN